MRCAAAAITIALLAGGCARAAPPFAPPVRILRPNGFRPTAVAAADFNGDGIADIVLAGGQNELLILTGDGRGGFKAGLPVPAGSNPSSMAVADMNGDGHLDVVIANHEADYVTLLLGDGAGHFTPRTLRLHSRPHPHAVALGDFDRDSRPDIAVDSLGENRFTLLFGRDEWRGPGTPVELGTNPYYTIAAADLDGDGNLDLITPNWGHGTVSILLGDGHGHFAHAAGSPFAAGPSPFSAIVADVNGDHRADIVVANYSGHADMTANDGLTWIRNDGGRHFTPFPERVARGDYSARVAAGDVNGDGFADCVFSNSNGASVTIVYGSSGGPRGTDSVATMPSPHALALADLDGDGRADLIVTGEKSDEILVFLTRRTAAK